MTNLGKQSLLLVCLLGGISFFQSSGQASSLYRKSSTCEEIGLLVMVENLEGSELEGVLCRDDYLKLDARTLINCKYGPKRRWLRPGNYNITNVCPVEESYPTVCVNLRGYSCSRSPKTIKVIGSTTFASAITPLLRWHNVEGASGYEVIIKPMSAGVERRYKVKSSSVKIEDSLEPGEYYEIDIHAIGVETSGDYLYHVLSEKDVELLNRTIAFIEEQDLSEIDKVLYLDSVYSSYGLLQEAIATLDNSAATQSSLTLKRRFAHQLSKAGYYKRAVEQFKKIAQIASEGSPELMEAEEILDQRQLPTNTKFPQK